MHLRPALRLMRLDKPIGIWLVLFPACWAVLMARHAMPDFRLLAMMLIGAVAMRSAGCIVNDLTDRKLDGAVERTRHRPLVTGEISVRQALGLLALLLAIALLLVMQLPLNVFLLSLLALPMIAAYPWMKRITWWPQLFLGLTFNFGVPIGWAATGAPFTAATLWLYAACIFWTLGYDTIYAMQDMADDEKIGIKSTARKLGKDLPRMVSACYAAMVICLLVAAAMAQMGFVFLVGILGVSWHLKQQLYRLRQPHAVAMAGRLFRSNQILGLWLIISLLIDRVVF